MASTGDMPATTAAGIDDRSPSPVISQTRWTKFVSLVWDSDYYIKSPAERRLVFKLDCMILSVVCLGWFMKYLDQANLANAYVSGMKEDLNILGNEYTYMQTVYNIAYAVLQVPSNLIILKVRPSWWLGMCEFGWMAFTFAQAGARNSNDMYAFRALVGLFEAAFQPVSLFLLASWYTGPELAKRTAFWMVSGIFGSAISGYLQAAIYVTLDGVAGFAGWRWLYIICGLLTFPSAVLTLFVLPDFPHNSKSRWLTEEERQLAIDRCARAGIAQIGGKLDVRLVKRIFGSWRIYLISITYLIYATSVQDVNYMAIWLGGNGVSVVLRNVWFAGTKLIAIPCFLFYGWLTDRLGNRFYVCFTVMVWALVPCGILAVHPKNFNLMTFAWFMTDTFVITPILFPWFNEICKANAEERAIVISTANLVFYIFNAWLPVVVFPQVEAPRFMKGFWTSFGMIVGTLFLLVALNFMHSRQKRLTQLAPEEEVTMESVDKEKEGFTDVNVVPK